MLSENKQQNSLEESKLNVGELNLSDISFLKDNPNLIYLYKKTEKLVSAIYLISNFISDKEPIKWQLRNVGLGLLSVSFSISSDDQKKFISDALRLLSILEIARTGGIISEMNYNILKYEFELLINTAETTKKKDSPQGLIFSDHFFEISQGQDNSQSRFFDSRKEVSTNLDASKGHNNLSDSLSVRKSNEPKKLSEQKQKDKSNRQDVIISLLSKSSELSIKDFTFSIKDCSEKTIQRELVSLVSKGQVKKMGEKRWSRYSLK